MEIVSIAHRRYQGPLAELKNQWFAFYKGALKRYKLAMVKAKFGAWQRFVEASLASNPWGVISRIAFHKKVPVDPCFNFRVNDRYTISEHETMNVILNGLFSEDYSDIDEAAHFEIRLSN